MNLQQKVQNYIQKHQLFIEKQPILVGVSGGTDSVGLLHILISLGYECIVAHCNFNLRTSESNRDEDFVRNLADSYNLPFYSVHFETNNYAKSNKLSIEMAARNLRYNWFKEMHIKTNSQAIAVAHHADDNIETLLINLVRGTGLRGLTGMKPINDKIVRPMLCCTRLEIQNYLVEHGLKFVEDSSNQSNDYLRNQFRNKLLPLLTEINPTYRENLYKTISNLNGNFAIYQHAIELIRNYIIDNSANEIKLNIERLLEQVDVPTVLFELLSPYGFNNIQTEQIEKALKSESGKVFYSDSYCVLKNRNYLIIKPKDIDKNNYYSISQNDETIFNPIHLTIKKIKLTATFKPSKLPTCIHIDSRFVKFPVVLRHWKEGDYLYPFGMNQKMKLSDFFINQKLSVFQKKDCWLLIIDEKIAWIVGQRLDNRFKVTEKTIEVIEFRIIQD